MASPAMIIQRSVTRVRSRSRPPRSLTPSQPSTPQSPTPCMGSVLCLSRPDGGVGGVLMDEIMPRASPRTPRLTSPKVVSMPRRIPILFAACVVGLIFLGAVAWKTGVFDRPAPAAVGGPFQLVDQNGRPADETLLKGK